MDKIDAYIQSKGKWEDALILLRKVLKKTQLIETIKWGIPCYTINGKNVLGMTGFKNHIAIWFFQGVYLKDQHNLLVNAQEGKTKSMRQIRFKSIKEIDKKIILEYVSEAIKIQKEQLSSK